MSAAAPRIGIASYTSSPSIQHHIQKAKHHVGLVCRGWWRPTTKGRAEAAAQHVWRTPQEYWQPRGWIPADVVHGPTRCSVVTLTSAFTCYSQERKKSRASISGSSENLAPAPFNGGDMLTIKESKAKSRTIEPLSPPPHESRLQHLSRWIFGVGLSKATCSSIIECCRHPSSPPPPILPLQELRSPALAYE